MKKILVIIITLMFCVSSFSQTFNRTSNKAIPDGGILIDSLTVSGLPTNMSPSFGIQDIKLNIRHQNNGEISVWIISPNGTSVLLTQGNGWWGANFQNTHFNYNTNNTAIYFNYPPFTGNFQPQEWLGTLNNGLEAANGKWYLKVADCCNQNTGILQNWSITFNNKPAPVITDTTSLPIIEVFTNGKDIVDEPKIMAKMKVIENANGALNHYNDTPTYTGTIGIEYRGSSSQSFPQKPYAVQTWDSLGNDLDTSLLGFPKHHNWIFYPPYNDKSLMRNVLMYNISNQMGHYASRTKYFQLYVNGMYQGIYVLMEKIARDKDRVNVSKLKSSTTSGAKLTGGYIIKIDKSTGTQNGGWNGISMICDSSSNTSETMYYQYDYPSSDSINQQQKTYIQNFITQFEQSLVNYSLYDTLHGYKKYVSLKTFVDHSMMVEFARNIDGYRLSSYYHKDKDSSDPHLKAGPIWDYNLSFGNGDYAQATDWNIWQWNLFCPENPVWWKLLFNNDSVYRQQYKCRYTKFRQNVLSLNNINHLIDSLESIVHFEQAKTYKRWPILGHYTWPNAYYPPTFKQEVDTLKSWIKNRLKWMDSKLLDNSCLTTLPVNIISFTGRMMQQKVALQWQVANELLLDKYVIERSFDGDNFAPIAELNAANQSTYQYIDDIKNIPNHKIFYRVKSVDNNGADLYSYIVVIYKLFAHEISIQPNPAKDYFIVNSNNIKQIKLLDYMGRTILSNQFPMPVTSAKISTQQVNKGLYLVEVIDKNGNVATQKLVIE